MRARLVAAVVAALIIGGCTPPTAAGSPQINDVTVFAAASLTDAFNRAGDEFAKTNARVRFIFNFGSSSTLATQITNGAPADVFASADEANMQKIVEAKLNVGAPNVFATNRLEIVV